MERHADAFVGVVERHSRHLYQLAYRLTGNEQDARDVVQEGLFRAYRQWRRFEGRSDPGTWLHRIVVNCAVDQLRAARSRPHHLAARPIHELAEVMASNTASPERLAVSAEAGRQIEEALAQLRPLERTTFILRHYEGRSIEEIGQTLGMRANAAKQQLFRAVRKLRLALD